VEHEIETGDDPRFNPEAGVRQASRVDGGKHSESRARRGSWTDVNDANPFFPFATWLRLLNDT
jgi:hypothetical protein